MGELIKINPFPRVAALLIWATSLLIVSAPALAATCLPGGGRSIDFLVDRIDDDPKQALSLIDTSLSHAATPERRAYLLGVRAIALGGLSRNNEAAAAARLAKTLLSSNAPALRDALTIIEASNSFSLDKGAEDLPALRRIVARYPASTELHICAATTAGDLERRAGHLVEAAHYLIDAFREARKANGRMAARTAHMLFKLIAEAGDDTTALALNASALRFYAERSARANTVLLTVFRARLLNKRGEFAQALALGMQAEALMRGRGDVIGDAYRRLEICRSLIGLRRLGEARRQCEFAHRAFVATSPDAAAQADILRARIALLSGRPSTARRLLDPVIAGPASRSSSVDINDAYRLRAEALRRIGNSRAAFLDLQEYTNRYRAWSEAARSRQTVVTGVWLSRDQQMLRASKAEARLARDSLVVARWVGWVRLAVIAGLLVFVMLVTLILVGMRHRRRLTAIALTDPLTGLRNRRGIISAAEVALTNAARLNHPVAIALIDLDHFKAINDIHGHAGGDAVLRALGLTARAILPSSASLGRWGGEEFLGVFPNTTATDASVLVQLLREAIRGETGTNIPIRFSAGIADWQPHQKPMAYDALIGLADAAAYRAKAEGRDRTCYAIDNDCPPWRGRTAPFASDR